MTLKAPAKIFLVLIFAALAWFGIQWYQNRPKDAQSTLVSSGETVIPDAPEASLPTDAKMMDLPSKTPTTNGVNLTWSEMAWQSQTGLNFANGGSQTTEGSLVESTGLNINIIRQDNPTLSVTEFVNNTVEYSKNPSLGSYAFTVMGSGVPMYFRMAYEGIKKSGLPDDYLPVVVLTFGKSYGEDQVIGDIKYRNNPQLLRGAVIIGVRLDGDLDMGMKLGSDNTVPLNTDGHTYDKKALNFIYSDDFLSCVNEYNQYTKFSLKVVENGKTTSRDTMVTADLVATWTPGDVRVAEGPRAAMSATIVSTKTYSSIMPNITIMSRKFVNDNRDKMVKLTAALATAGDQIKSYTQIRKYACGLNAKIWNEQNAEYWYQYFTPQNRLNMTLGGSMVFNLSDMNNMFGMNGKAYVYKSIYNTFAKLQSKLYPEDFAKNEMFPQGYVPFEQVVDNSILYEANQKYTQLQLSKEFKADYSGSIKNVVSDKEMHILFETGKYDIPNNMYDELNELAEALIATQGLKIKVEGHTDNVGNALSNKELSQKRADAVVQYLINKGIELERITSEGFGDVKPKASNSTSEGRSINRRVEIIQGN